MNAFCPRPASTVSYTHLDVYKRQVLAYFVVNSKQQGFDYANKMLELGGLGHSAVIHTGDMKIADEYGVAMRVGRIIVNSPSSQGAIGDIYNTCLLYTSRCV